MPPFSGERSPLDSNPPPDWEREHSHSFFELFGLSIASVISPPPGVAAVEKQPGSDVTVRRGSVPGTLGTGEALRIEGASPQEKCRLLTESCGRFLVEGGRRVWVDGGGSTESDLRSHFLGGPLMGILLYQLGGLVLHGAAVETPAGTVALLGSSGQGKSTLAAGLLREGGRLVTDDLVALQARPSETIQIRRGPPTLRLRADAADAVGAEQAFPSLCTHPTSGKTIHRVPTTNQPESVLDAVIVLEETKPSAWGRLAQLEAFKTLLGHTYVPGLLGKRGEHQMGPTARLVRSVPVWTLSTGTRLGDLPRLVDQVRGILEETDQHGPHGRGAGDERPTPGSPA